MLKQAPFLSLLHAQFTNIYLLPPPFQHPWLPLHVMLCMAISCHEEAGVLCAIVSFLHADIPLLSSLPIRLPGLQHSPHRATLFSKGTAPPAAAGASHVPTPELFLMGPSQFLTPPAELGKQQKQGRMRPSEGKQGQTQP